MGRQIGCFNSNWLFYFLMVFEFLATFQFLLGNDFNFEKFGLNHELILNSVFDCQNQPQNMLLDFCRFLHVFCFPFFVCVFPFLFFSVLFIFPRGFWGRMLCSPRPPALHIAFSPTLDGTWMVPFFFVSYGLWVAARPPSPRAHPGQRPAPALSANFVAQNCCNYAVLTGDQFGHACRPPPVGAVPG